MLKELDRVMVPKTNGKRGWAVGIKVLAYKFGVSDYTLRQARLRRGHYAGYPKDSE